MITKETATDIALAYREVEISLELLQKVNEEIAKNKAHIQGDVRDVFGRRVNGLQLGIPSGDNSQRLFYVDWELAKPIIEAHIAKQNARIAVLNQKALAEGGE